MDRKDLTGRERTFPSHEIIVSKTDPQGRIVYANEVFTRVSGFSEAELIGKPHSIVRHPDMPRCVFKALWDTISAGDEIFAYVLNRAKNGDHYWVFACVTPSFSADGRISGYHSSRRAPRREAIAAIEPLFQALAAEESRFASSKEGMEAGERMLKGILADKGVSYGAFVFSL